MVRRYSTKKMIYAFDSRDVVEAYNLRSFDLNENVNDIYSYLCDKGLVYTDNYGNDRLTDRALDMYWGRFRKADERGE